MYGVNGLYQEGVEAVQMPRAYKEKGIDERGW